MKKLIDYEKAVSDLKMEFQNIAYPHTVFYVLEKQPEVKAITVEWIKKYMKPFEEFCKKLPEDTRKSSGAAWVLDIINTMIEEWKAENGKALLDEKEN